MDKKKEMNFNLNNFLLALSLPCDFKRKEYFNSSLNYSKRVAYIALNIASKLNFTPQEMSDLCSYSLIHSVGLFKGYTSEKEYLQIAQDIYEKLPFLLKNEEIDELNQLLSFSILLNEKFDFGNLEIEKREEVISFIEENSNLLFKKEFRDIFVDLSKNISFWLELENENDMLYFIFGNLYDFTTVLTFEQVLDITSSFYKIINPNSNLLELVSKCSDFYSFDHKDKLTFLIAASLSNIGKACISTKILNKNSSLDKNEYEIVKAYPYYTKKILSNIIGFNDISSWACKVQERIDSSGYPFGLSGKDLSFKDRVLALLVTYDSLRNKNSYREAYNHKEAIEIISSIEGLDKAITKDLDTLFK